MSSGGNPHTNSVRISTISRHSLYHTAKVSPESDPALGVNENNLRYSEYRPYRAPVAEFTSHLSDLSGPGISVVDTNPPKHSGYNLPRRYSPACLFGTIFGFVFVIAAITALIVAFATKTTTTTTTTTSTTSTTSTTTTTTTTTTTSTSTTTTTTPSPCICTNCGQYATYTSAYCGYCFGGAFFQYGYYCGPTYYCYSSYTTHFGIVNGVPYTCSITNVYSACYYGGITDYPSFCRLGLCNYAYFAPGYYLCT